MTEDQARERVGMQRRRCPGSGLPAVAGKTIPGTHPAEAYSPFCPACGRELTAQGRKHRYTRTNPWIALPVHMSAVRD